MEAKPGIFSVRFQTISSCEVHGVLCTLPTVHREHCCSTSLVSMYSIDRARTMVRFAAWYRGRAWAWTCCAEARVMLEAWVTIRAKLTVSAAF